MNIEKRMVKKPFYPGGHEAMNKFIADNIQYPKEAIENKVEGVCIVQYDIDVKGNVLNPKVLSGVGYGCDEEAIRLVKLLKFEVPKQIYKLKVTFHKTTHIRFKLNKQAIREIPKYTEPNLQINYHIQSEVSTKPAAQPTKQNTSYSYSVKIG